MIKKKINVKDYNRILFTSDTHYGHNKHFLWQPRGFNDPRDHDKWLEDQFSELNSSDLLVHLGDFGLSVGPTAIRDFMNMIPCETLTVWGNHNSGVHQAYTEQLPRGFENCEIYPLKITQNITMLGQCFMLDILGVGNGVERFFCQHMAALIWDEQSKNRHALIGHSHSNLRGANPNVEAGLGKILDVGVDNAVKYNNTAFFSLEEVVDIMSVKSYSHWDHH